MRNDANVSPWRVPARVANVSFAAAPLAWPKSSGWRPRISLLVPVGFGSPFVVGQQRLRRKASRVITSSTQTFADGIILEEFSLERPALYVVSTPIGNLRDITLRALQVLKEADAIFAEDTRTTSLLLSRLGVDLAQRPLLQYHAFNEDQASQSILRRLRDGQSVALVSDAGTPLISDPGFAVLQVLHSEGFPARCVPGPCALVAALSVAGLPCSSVLFGGFLPSKGEKKLSHLQSLLRQAASATLVLYEAPHRLVNTLELLQEIESDGTRQLAICRELTKRYETILRGSICELLKEVKDKQENQKGEVVILIGGVASGAEASGDIDPTKVLQLLRAELPESRAVSLAAKICGVPKKTLSEIARRGR